MAVPGLINGASHVVPETNDKVFLLHDMNDSHIFISCSILFICGWSIVALLYLFAVIPELKKHDRKVLFEAGFQLNLSGHIREYGLLAKQEKNKRKLNIYYLINVLICASIFTFLAGVLSTVF